MSGSGIHEIATDIAGEWVGRPEAYRSWLARGVSGGPGWMPPTRREAFERFVDLGFPTAKHEEWRHTNLAPFLRTAFMPAANPAPREPLAALLAEHPFAALGGPRLTFIDGRYAAEWSAATLLPAGVRLGPLATADALAARGHLGRCARWEEFALVAMNTALFADGAYLEIDPGASSAEPILVLHVTTALETETMCHPRCLIVCGRDSRATVVESYLSLGGEPAWTNAVTEIVLASGAVLDHCRVQQENSASVHLSAVFAQQGPNTRLAAHSITLGGALTRNDVTATLAGEGAETLLNGLYIAAGRQHIDNHTVLDHAQPLGTSREYYKGILDDRATTAFRGRIVVRPDAQHTDAVQSNKNLLLSPDAEAGADPQLEIRADDVRCTHGATVGQIDPEALFYLCSRGIDEISGRQLLTYAFAHDVLARLGSAVLRRRLERELFQRWTGNPEGIETGGQA